MITRAPSRGRRSLIWAGIDLATKQVVPVGRQPLSSDHFDAIWRHRIKGVCSQPAAAARPLEGVGRAADQTCSTKDLCSVPSGHRNFSQTNRARGICLLRCSWTTWGDGVPYPVSSEARPE